jgi:D-3-phosphoglycerate dehydrogenase
MTHRVLIADEWFAEQPLKRLQEHFQVTRNTKGRWYRENELLDVIGEYDAVIAGQEPYTTRVLEKARKLKIIARRGIGYDNIDLETARKRHICITNTPVRAEHIAVAELTLTLILDLLRRTVFSCEFLRSDTYKSTRLWRREDFFGRGIHEIIIGIVGLGNIGREVAKLANKLGSTVIYSDPYVNEPTLKRVSLKELFERADVVTVHVRSTDETRGMINYDLFSRMKIGSCFVNTARPDVVKTNDLKLALKNGVLTAAATDVFDVEPPIDDELLRMRNVIVTPHIAGFTYTSLDSIDGTCADNVIAVLLNEGQPKNRIV